MAGERSCWAKEEETLLALREAFEEQADTGRLTKHRRLVAGMGFYPLPKGALNTHRYQDYDKLGKLSVREAVKKILFLEA